LKISQIEEGASVRSSGLLPGTAATVGDRLGLLAGAPKVGVPVHPAAVARRHDLKA